MVFWHPKGWTLYRQIQTYIRSKLCERGYEEIRTPEVVDRTLWERSGHWDKFRIGAAALRQFTKRGTPCTPSPTSCQLYY